jgi:hypothetical protein
MSLASIASLAASVPQQPPGEAPRARRAMTDNGTFCHADGGHEGGDRRRRVLMLPTLTLRVRVAYMGAKVGSATMTSCPSASRQPATHSLSVEASTKIRAGAAPRAPPRSAPSRCGSAARSPRPPPRGCRSGFPSCGRRWQYGPWLAFPLCGLDRRVLLWGRICHHVQREASRFILSTLRGRDARGRPSGQGGRGWPARQGDPARSR